MTTSCHHPPAHLVDEDKVRANPRLLHNTDQKKDDRRKMIQGQRPSGCEYCWKIEDMGREAVSDRVYKSKIYPIESLHEAYNTPIDQDVDLKTLEIAFDRTCQFACSYCNPAFSSAWVRDIHQNGPYRNLKSDGRNHFTHTHNSSQLYKFGEDNPYVNAFFSWWESDLHRTLQELRITGGEPLMSGYTWQLIEWFKENQGKSKTRLAINSNLGFDKERLEYFIESIRVLPHVELYTSMEATGPQAEYIRDGLVYTQWENNVHTILKSSTVKKLHVMCTINALCLTTLDKFLKSILDLKRLYGRDQVNFTLNILRFPSFQSPLVLPDEIRKKFEKNLHTWMMTNSSNPLLHEHEINHVHRLIEYLDVVKTPHSDTFDMPSLKNDFREFYQQYDQRRNKNFVQAFPELKNWYESI